MLGASKNHSFIKELASSELKDFLPLPTSLALTIFLLKSNSASFLRSLQKKNDRDSDHSISLSITPTASIRPGVSCSSQNWTAICSYTGSNSFSLCEIDLSIFSRSSSLLSSLEHKAFNLSSSLCIVFSRSLTRYLTLAAPLASRTPPRALPADAYISITDLFIEASSTTHAPPLISANGGIRTKTGCSYATKASTMRAPYLRTSSNMSLCPPLNPLQFANTIRGRSSVRKSLIACAVLYALLGNQTHPAS
mmetsp:Transcript_9387/g.10950  ORF Transcript_9387/g.10950 Transcript_9387/m.10950 type:complete len:251 (-) Transcript_9387:3498-4250(-)